MIISGTALISLETDFGKFFGVSGFDFGGGGVDILRSTACCSFLAEFTSPPLFKFVSGTVRTISIVTSGWSSGKGLFNEGRPTTASSTTPRCIKTEMINERGFIALYQASLPDYLTSGS